MNDLRVTSFIIVSLTALDVWRLWKMAVVYTCIVLRSAPTDATDAPIALHDQPTVPALYIFIMLITNYCLFIHPLYHFIHTWHGYRNSTEKAWNVNFMALSLSSKTSKTAFTIERGEQKKSKNWGKKLQRQFITRHIERIGGVVSGCLNENTRYKRQRLSLNLGAFSKCFLMTW